MNVQKLGPNGQAVAVVGVLADDGKGVDTLAGDGVYSGVVLLNETQTGIVSLRVTAAVRGSLLRLASPTFSLEVLPTGAPTNLSAPDPAKAQFDTATGVWLIPDEVIACFLPSTSYATVISIAQTFQSSVIGRFADIGNCYQFRLTGNPSPAGVHAVEALLSSRPEILFADADAIFRLAAEPCATPVLPTCIDTSYSKLNLDDAHDISTGAGILIAELDTGIDYTNNTLNPPPAPPLQSRILEGFDFTQTPPGNNPIDVNGHGTAVAGILAATAPDAYILATKISGPIGPSAFAVLLGLQDAIRRHVNVVNMSFASSQNHPSVNLMLQRAKDNGITLVGSAGDGTETKTGWDLVGQSAIAYYPGAYSSVINVGAVDNSYNRAVVSNFGFTVPLAAPGVDIFTTALSNDTTSATGTSFATPFVAGSAALILSGNPGFPPAKVEQILEDTAVPLANNSTDFPVGVIDPVAAVGALRITHTGLTPNISLLVNVTADATSASIVSKLVTLSPNGSVDIPIKSSDLAAGQYTLTVFLNNDNATFDYQLFVTVPGVSFTAFSGFNPNWAGPQNVNGTLFGFATRIATLKLSK